MRIIINADDFGRDDDTVDATIECFEQGALTGATIMPKMPATARAIEFALAARPAFSFGVHLTYVREGDQTPESPMCAAEEVADLAGADGRFLPSNVVRRRVMLGQIAAEAIERETVMQIQSLLDRGVRVSHVDSHGHLHKFKAFRSAIARVLPRFGITRVRGVQDVYLSKPLRSPTFWLWPMWRGKLRRFVNPEHFFMPNGAKDKAWPAMLLNRVKGDTLEVGVHPGRAEAWREAERMAVQEFTQAARAGGHELIGWKDL